MPIPLSLSVYEHAARFISRTPWETSRDGDLMFAAHKAAYETYRHGPVIVGIDIYNLEAEAYGGVVAEPNGNGIPAIVDHPCSSLADIRELTRFDPARSGRLPMVVDVARGLKDALPDADVRVPLSGPFSIAGNLVGLNALLMGVVMEPEDARESLDWLVDGQLEFARAVSDAGVGVAFFESAAAPPLLSPDLFRTVELPPLKRALRGVAELTGRPAPCIIGGDTAPIVDAMLETGTNFLICPSETDRTAFLIAVASHPDVAVRINIDPGIYTHGTRDEIAAAVDEVVSLAASRPNVLLGTGAIPLEAPVENVLFVMECAAKA
jgi:uroporphyrinogen-III decarboxylase